MAGVRQKWWIRLWNWIWRKKALEAEKSPFKEFIYLDDISVVSLLVSRVGELTDEIQEGWAREDSLGSEVGTNVGVKDVSSVDTRSSFQTKSSQSVQATRKANIQSQFRRLHQEVRDAGLLFPVETSADINSVDELLADPNLARSFDSVTRGLLIELDVQLSADPLFDKSSIITEVAEISEDHPEVFGGNPAGFVPAQMRSFARLLDRFMAGLVPIRCRVLNVSLYEDDGLRFLVSKVVADRLNLVTKEIELVAVLEKDRFWKDMRRVLFSNAAVTVLGRVSVDGLHQTWTPVKLLDLFKKTVPNGDDMVTALQSISFDQTSLDEEARRSTFAYALRVYVDLWVAEVGGSLTAAQQSDIDRTVHANCAQGRSAEQRRHAFRAIAELLAEAAVAVEPSRDVDIRQAALRQAGIDAFGDVRDSHTSRNPSSPTVDSQLLEVEVAAMYW